MSDHGDGRDGDAGVLPVLRLRPGKGRAFLSGHPWLYKDEVVLDRRTRGLSPGTVCRVEDTDRKPVGLAAINPGSGIAARALDRDPDAVIDAAWMAERLGRAFGLRERMFARPFYRLCHGEGDGLPGLVIDRFDGLVVIQPNTAWAEASLDGVVAALDGLFSPETILVNRDSRGRVQEGLSDGREVLRGTVPEAVAVEGPRATLFAAPDDGQKTGVYFDQFPNHDFVAGLAEGASVLDVFSHTGGFALSALSGGARSAHLVDGSARALDLAARGVAHLGRAADATLEKADAFDAMRALAQQDRRFDIVVCDPPAFAPRKEALEAGLRAYQRVARLAEPLVAAGGFLVVCSCSHAISPDALRAASARPLALAGRSARLIRSSGAGPDHPVHPALPESGYLKVLVFALD